MPGAISVVTLVSDADDQSFVQLAPLNSEANVPLIKLCIAEAEMVDALADVGAKPNVV